MKQPSNQGDACDFCTLASSLSLPPPSVARLAPARVVHRAGLVPIVLNTPHADVYLPLHFAVERLDDLAKEHGQLLALKLNLEA